MCTALERLEERGREAGRIEGREDIIARYEAENGITTKVSSVDELMEKLNAGD